MSQPGSLTVRVPLMIRRRPGRKTVVTPGGNLSTVRTASDPALVKALARAFRWQRLLDEGRYASVSALAAAERIERGYLGTVLRLTLLAPWVVEAIMDGTAGGLTLQEVMGEVATVWTTAARPT